MVDPQEISFKPILIKLRSFVSRNESLFRLAKSEPSNADSKDYCELFSRYSEICESCDELVGCISDLEASLRSVWNDQRVEEFKSRGGKFTDAAKDLCELRTCLGDYVPWKSEYCAQYSVIASASIDLLQFCEELTAMEETMEELISRMAAVYAAPNSYYSAFL